MNVITVSGGTCPLTLAEVNQYLKTLGDDTAENTYVITPIIETAREYCENITGVAVGENTYCVSYDADELAQTVRLPRSPVSSVTSVKYIDTDGTEQTMSADDYVLDVASGRLMFVGGTPLTANVIGAVAITFEAGSETTIPPTIRQAMLLLIGHWYEHREAVELNLMPYKMEIAVKTLLNQNKRWWF